MYATPWIKIIIVSIVLSCGNTFYALAAPLQKIDHPLEITIMTMQAEAITGSAMTWRVILTPKGQQEISFVELETGDKRIWAWLDTPEIIQTLTETQVLDVPVIPLISGELTPAIEVHYIVADMRQSLLVVGDNTVQVSSIESYIEADIIVQRGTVREGKDLPSELWIRNRSPFTLTQVQVYGIGADLAWGRQIMLKDILPNQAFWESLTPTVVGRHPQPQLRINYTWIDTSGASHNQFLYINSAPVSLEKGFLEVLPDETLGILVGVLAATLSTFTTGLVGAKLTRRLQKGINRRHVRGLLQLLIMQSEYAADNGVTVGLEPLETILKDEGLFAILEEDNLAENARSLWKNAERHNTGLDQPGGPQRAQELRNAAQALEEKLIGRVS